MGFGVVVGVQQGNNHPLGHTSGLGGVECCSDSLVKLVQRLLLFFGGGPIGQHSYGMRHDGSTRKAGTLTISPLKA